MASPSPVHPLRRTALWFGVAWLTFGTGLVVLEEVANWLLAVYAGTDNLIIVSIGLSSVETPLTFVCVGMVAVGWVVWKDFLWPTRPTLGTPGYEHPWPRGGWEFILASLAAIAGGIALGFQSYAYLSLAAWLRSTQGASFWSDLFISLPLGLAAVFAGWGLRSGARPFVSRVAESNLTRGATLATLGGLLFPLFSAISDLPPSSNSVLAADLYQGPTAGALALFLVPVALVVVGFLLLYQGAGSDGPYLAPAAPPLPPLDPEE